MTTETAPAARFWRLPQVRAYTGLSKSTIERGVIAGTFPRPARLSENRIAWPAAEIVAWAEARIAARYQVAA